METYVYTVVLILYFIIIAVEFLIIRLMHTHKNKEEPLYDFETLVITAYLAFLTGIDMSKTVVPEFQHPLLILEIGSLIDILGAYIIYYLISRIIIRIYASIKTKLRKIKHSSKKDNPCLSCPDYDEYIGCTIADLPFCNPDCPKEGDIP